MRVTPKSNHKKAYTAVKQHLHEHIEHQLAWRTAENLALYQHSCHEVQSSYNTLSVKELQQRSAISLLSQ